MTHISLPLKRSVAGLVVLQPEAAGAAVMVEDVEVKSGEGEGEEGPWGSPELKQASSELLPSTGIVPKRSRPEEAALALLSEGAKGSFGEKWGVGVGVKYSIAHGGGVVR